MMEDPAAERLILLMMLLGLFAGTTAIAFACGFFKKLSNFAVERIDFGDVFSLISMVLVLKIFVGPASFVVGYRIVTGEYLTEQELAASPAISGWLNLVVTAQLLLGLAIYLFILRPSVRPILFGKSRRPVHDLLLGGVSWFIVYPAVLFWGNLMEWVALPFTDGVVEQQTAVRFFLEMKDEEGMLWLTVAAIAIVVPLIEELVFRGVVQQWLRSRFSPLKAIVFTSLFFGLAHFSLTQGWTNLSIISSLFILSVALGYLRERQRNLLAPIGLHMTFNTATLMFIVFQRVFTN